MACACTREIACQKVEPQAHTNAAEWRQALTTDQTASVRTEDEEKLRRALDEVDLDEITPRQAFDLLSRWKGQL